MAFLKAFYIWKVDETKGRKPWQDPTLIAVFVSLMANLLARKGIVLGTEDQQITVQAIIAVLSFISIVVCRLLSPHVGLRAQTPAEVAAGVPSATVVDPAASPAIQASQAAMAEPAKPFAFPSHSGSDIPTYTWKKE
jgi:hypothetical protein